MVELSSDVVFNILFHFLWGGLVAYFLHNLSRFSISSPKKHPFFKGEFLLSPQIFGLLYQTYQHFSMS